MKPLNLKETLLKEEMKERCLAKGQYIDENAKAKFEMLCHLENFEIKYWELQKENKILKENAENNDKVVDKVNWENQLLKKENEQLKCKWNKLKEYFNERIKVCDNRLSSPFCNFEKATKERLIFSQCLEKLEELEEGSDSNDSNR